MAIKTKIKNLNHQGKGIGNYNGKVIFIPNALPGEEVEFELINEKKKYGTGKVVNYLTTSKDRITPSCSYYYECGGCQLSHLKYEKQLEFKKDTLINLLKKYADLDIVPRVIKSKPFNYRNKITLKVINYKWGYYKEKSHQLVEIDNCLLAKEAINKLLENKKFLKIKNGELIIRCNHFDELLIQIKSKSKVEVDIEGLSKLNVIGIILNDKPLLGQKYLIEKINNLNYQINYENFFQLNNEVLKEVFNILNNKTYNTVLDLYCGAGTLGIAINKQKLFGIESSKSSIASAIVNNKLNNQNNAYIVGDASKIKDIDNIATVIIDPPRSGMNDKTLNHLLDKKPKEIIYMSCNPITLARDLKELKSVYEIKETYLLDMFPQTYHIESLVIMNFKEHNKIYQFEAIIEKNPEMDATYIKVPIDIKKEFGKGRLKVTAQFDDVLYDGSIVNMGIKNDDGSICYIIGMPKEIRKKINKEAGDSIKAIIKEHAEKYVDLHMHTTYSDGTENVIELLKKCEEAKFSLISITDHDSVEAYFELEKIDYKKHFSGEIIIGGEFKAVYNNQSIEILAYGFDSDKLRDLNKEIRDGRTIERQAMFLAHLKEVGNKIGLKFNQNIKIDEENYFACHTFVDEIIKYPENIAILKTHGIVEDVTGDNFYRQALRNPESVFCIKEKISIMNIEDVIKAIHQAGGLAFLAHPLDYAFDNPLKEIEIIIKTYPELDGIECYNSFLSEEDSPNLIALANKYNKYISGGSDYHGEHKNNNLGGQKVNYDLVKNWVEKIKKL